MARSFDPYGALLSGSGGDPFGYTGEYSDGYSGLIWLRARWYAPYLDQFIEPDTVTPEPTDPQDSNLCMYAKANPLVLRDPTGHRECTDPCSIEPWPPAPVTDVLYGWLVTHNMQDLQAEPEDVLLARLVLGQV